MIDSCKNSGKSCKLSSFMFVGSSSRSIFARVLFKGGCTITAIWMIIEGNVYMQCAANVIIFGKNSGVLTSTH